MPNTRAAISSRYTRFAEQDAHGRSPLYETLAHGIAGDPAIIDFLASLPPDKQQPNLLLAAVRHVFGTPAGWGEFRTNLLASPETVRAAMMTHATQTNEPARCATLLPVLAALPQPLALIEVGASAGLCLLPDRYRYDYGAIQIRPKPPARDFPTFVCTVNETTPLPAAMPEIIWRAGLDLNPIDVADPRQAAWLENLVWPEQTQRLHHLRAAMRIARTVKPRVIKGNLLQDDLVTLISAAPPHATRVVFHTAVLAYVPDRKDSAAFAKQVTGLCHYWLSNESPQVFPEIAARAPSTPKPGQFLLSVNGGPVAWTDPHGSSIEWIAPRASNLQAP